MKKNKILMPVLSVVLLTGCGKTTSTNSNSNGTSNTIDNVTENNEQHNENDNGNTVDNNGNTGDSDQNNYVLSYNGGDDTFEYPYELKANRNGTMDLSSASDSSITGQLVTVNPNTFLGEKFLHKEGFSFFGDGLTKKLPEPDTTITSNEKLRYVFDYASFYKLPSISLTFDSSFCASSKIGQCLNKQWWAASSTQEVLGFSKVITNNKVDLTFYYNDDTCSYVGKNNDLSACSTIPYSFYTINGEGIRSVDNSVFPYQTKNKKGDIDVYNSNQLIYCLMNGYNPICIKDSGAEKIFNRAKQILNGIINDKMIEAEKALAINSYLISNCVYAYEDEEFMYYASEEATFKNFPDIIASNFASSFAEGPLFDYAGICQGFARAYALLATIEGIETVKVSSSGIDIDETDTICCVSIDTSFDSHGYCYNKIDGKYYVADPTYCCAGTIYSNTGGEINVYRFPTVLLSEKHWFDTYGNIIKEDYFAEESASQIALEDYDTESLMKFMNKGTIYSYKISTANDFENFANNIIDYVKGFNNKYYFHGDKGLYFDIQFVDNCYDFSNRFELYNDISKIINDAQRKGHLYYNFFLAGIETIFEETFDEYRSQYGDIIITFVNDVD